jgi:hypothetical protein
MSEEEAQELASLLAALVTAPRSREAMGRFRRDHLAEAPPVSIDRLLAVRDLVAQLARALLSGDEAAWEGASLAAESLQREEESAEASSVLGGSSHSAGAASQAHDATTDKSPQDPMVDEPTWADAPTSVAPPVPSTTLRSPSEPWRPPTDSTLSGSDKRVVVGITRARTDGPWSATKLSPTTAAVDVAATPSSPPVSPPDVEAEALASHTVTAAGRRMTTADYAALCAACGAFPRRAREIQLRFGIGDDAARRALDDAWDDSFRSDDRLEELWRTLVQRFRGWLLQYGNL